MVGNLKFEAYFEVLYPLWVFDSLKTLNLHHCLSLASINWLPLATIDLVGDIRNLKFEAYFKVLCPFSVHFGAFKGYKGHHYLLSLDA